MEELPSARRLDFQCDACCNTPRHESFSPKASMLRIPHSGRGPGRRAASERRTRGMGNSGAMHAVEGEAGCRPAELACSLFENINSDPSRPSSTATVDV